MNTSPRWITLSIGLLGFSGVALGAFGAHALKETLTARGTLGSWQTAVLYQLVHAAALLALSGRAPGGKITGIAWCWVIGTVLFSGSLYWLALGGPKFLGPLTPLGGLGLLAGWLLIARQAFLSPPQS